MGFYDSLNVLKGVFEKQQVLDGINMRENNDQEVLDFISMV